MSTTPSTVRIDADTALASDGYILTYRGLKVYPLDPKPSSIDIGDIAHALSNTGRFTGHSRRFYSVAQHCCHVSDCLSPDIALWGLLHDGAEAYIADVSTPLKHLPDMAPYREAEAKLQKMIYRKFKLTGPEPIEVKEADTYVFKQEWVCIMGQNGTTDLHITPWTPSLAETAFLQRFGNLTRS